MAELVDALASGARDRKVVEVRVLSWAPFFLSSLRTCETKGTHRDNPSLPERSARTISTSGPPWPIDCETMGLNPHRGRLSVVPLSSGDGNASRAGRQGSDRGAEPRPPADRSDVLKLFHFGRFDIAVMYHAFGALAAPVYCTKIASKLIRTYTDRHRPEITCCRNCSTSTSPSANKAPDWGAAKLTEAQRPMPPRTVLYLHRLKEALDDRLIREGRHGTGAIVLRFPAHAGANSTWPVGPRSTSSATEGRMAASNRYSTVVTWVKWPCPCLPLPCCRPCSCSRARPDPDAALPFAAVDLDELIRETAPVAPPLRRHDGRWPRRHHGRRHRRARTREPQPAST